ncbi:hypothetical protein ABZ128_11085 [Streptomyces sp. NPDC006326]|uniref:hypothetical protein n=1 Tax=Streptomyces sp. NPDC006326 TaxID=3156752 RepID=UPI0033A403D9
MPSTRLVQRASALTAGVLAVALLVCGVLFTHSMPMHGTAMDAGPAASMVRPGEHASVGMEGDCPTTAMQCPLASAQVTTAAGPVSDLAPGPGWGTSVATTPSSVSARHLLSCRPRAPDLDSLCISRT